MEGKRLYECDTGSYPGRTGDSDWSRFSRAAAAAGYANGFSCANDCGLWDRTVDEAIAFCTQQEAADASN